MTAFIVYGSLYPFQFHGRPDASGPLTSLLLTWRFRPEHFGNLVGNVFLYMPFGLFAALAMGDGVGRRIRIAVVALLGAVLCLTMELIQFYVPGRISTFADIYPNVLGTVLGALAAVVLGAHFHRPLTPSLHRQPIPLLLLGAFLAYRLFPYLPSLDLHQYWQALKPVVLRPQFEAYDIARYAVMWLVVARLGGALLGSGRARLLLAPATLCVAGAQVAIVNNSINAAEVVGAATACVLWLALSAMHARYQSIVIALALATFVIVARLQPLDFLAVPRDFGWIPFQSFLHGSMAINTLSFLEKFFLYGSLIWVLTGIGVRLATASLGVASGLLATSVLQTYLPDRSAEITDAVLALAIAGMFALITNAGAGRNRHDYTAEKAVATPPPAPRSGLSQPE